MALAGADLKGDGLPDLVVANAGDNTVSVLLNTTIPGAGTFAFGAKQDFPTGTNPSYVAIRDLNGDGKQDVIAANAGDNTVSVLLNTTVPGAAAPTFKMQQTFATGNGPVSLAVGDLNGDGQPDLVAANSAVGANSVSVLLNTTVLLEATNVAAVGDTQFSFPSRNQVVAVGDINNDGKPDLVISPIFGARSVSIFLNTTQPGSIVPTFSGPTSFGTGDIPNFVGLADFNGDGKLDLFAGNGNSTVGVLINVTPPGASVPSFLPPVAFTTGNIIKNVAAADINGDGKPDLVVVSYYSAVDVLLNQTAPGAMTPSFGNLQAFATGGGTPTGTVADVNGDGRPDLIFTGTGNTVSVLLNTTTPGAQSASFAPRVTFAVGHVAHSVAVADLNGDGKPDLIVECHGYGAPFYSEAILLNTTIPGAATVSFAPRQTLFTSLNDTQVTVSDVNGDGKPDLVIDYYGKSSVFMLLNTTTPGASTASFSAHLAPAFTKANSSSFVAVGDFNGDGRPDFVVTNQKDNTFAVLTNSAALIATGTATATIKGLLASASATANENAGSFSIPASLAAAAIADTAIPITVAGTAVSGVNYSGLTPSPLVIRAGQTAGTITLALIDDGRYDTVDKTLVLTIGAPVNIRETLTIHESDPPPTVSFAGASESTGENAGTFSIPITLSAPSNLDTTVPFTVGGSASAGVDYSGVTSSPLVIPAGQTTAMIPGRVNDDAGSDAFVGITFTLGTPTNATLGTATTNTLTIAELPTITWPSPMDIFNGTPLDNAQLNATASVPGTFSYSPAAGTVLPAGQNQTLSVTFVPTDAIHYAAVTVSVPINVIAAATTVSIADASALEPAPGGTVNMDFTITRTGDLSGPLTVGYTTVPGTAQPKTDFTPQNGTATFAAGSATTTISIPIFGNGVFSNPSLSFSLQLTDFLPQASFAASGRPLAVAVGDINGDGKPDVVGADYSSNSVGVLLNTTAPGARTPSCATQQSFACGKGPIDLALGDVNGDGKADVIVANLLDNSVAVLLNTTTPGASTVTFGAPAVFQTGSRPISVAVGDINGDGKPDFAVANSNSNTASLFLNTTPNGAAVATFALQPGLNVGRLAGTIAIADLNGDGKPDILAATGDRIVWVFTNRTVPGAATATFATPQSFDTSPVRGPVDVAVGDLNGDGKPDLAFADDVRYASVLANASAGPFGVVFDASKTFEAANNPASVTIADVNGDGRPDLVLTDSSNGDVVVLLNTTRPGATGPRFAAPKIYAAGRGPRDVAVADVNGDGLPDFVVANADDNTVSVLLKGFQAITRSTSVGTIIESDLPIVSLKNTHEDVSVTTNSFSLTVSLSTAAPLMTTIPFTLSGTAVAGVDYAAITASPLVIPPGQTSATITLNVLTPPPGLNKTLTVTLNAPTNAKLGTIAADTLTFIQPNTLAIADASATEPAPGIIGTMINFTVTRTGDPASLTIGYTMAPGTAQPNTDFTPQTGTVIFAAGAATTTISIPILGNGVYNNPSLTFSVNLTGFSDPYTFTTGGSGAVSVATADFNGDGKPDLVVGNRYDDTASILLNTTTSDTAPLTFGPQGTFGVGGDPFSAAVGDFNGDGKPDIAIDNSSGQSISVLLNRTARGSAIPAIGAQATFSINGYSTSVAVGDINGDGKPDLIAVNNSGSSVAVLLNLAVASDAFPTFAPAQVFPTGSKPTYVTVADVNGDGKPDLVLTNFLGNSVSVLLNTTPAGAAIPTFATQQTIAVGTKPRFLTVADVNGDGRPDLIVTNTADNTVSVLLNTTAPGAMTLTWAAQKTFATGTNPVSVAAADVNGDGKPDLIVDNNLDGTVSVLLNLTPPGASVPAFATQQTFFVGGSPFSLAVADFNGDGRPDLAITTPFAIGLGKVSVLLNSPISATGTIVESDPRVSFVSTTQTVHESDGNFSIPIKLSVASPVATTIPFTLGGTAVAGTNFRDVTSSPLIIPPGQTSGVIFGKLLDDGHFDLVNKTLTVTLGTPINGTLPSPQTDTLTIVESDPLPTVSFAVAGESTDENAGTFNVAVKLSAASKVDTTIPFMLGGTAVSGSDYSVNNSSLTIPAGQTTGTITGTLINDYAMDRAQTLTFTLGTPTNATLGAITTNTLTIAETPATASITYKTGYAAVTEPSPGKTAPYYFTIALDDIPTKAVTVYYQTRDGSAKAGEDYRGVNSYKVTFPAFAHGATANSPPSQDIAIIVNGDASDGTDPETFSVVLSSAYNATIKSAAKTATATITQLPPPPAVTANIADFSAAGPSAGSTVFDISVTLANGPAAQAITVYYSTTDGTANAGADYVGSQGHVTIAAGQTIADIPITVLADAAAHMNLTFTITIYNWVNAAIVSSTATVTIVYPPAAPATVVPADSILAQRLSNQNNAAGSLDARDQVFAELGSKTLFNFENTFNI